MMMMVMTIIISTMQSFKSKMEMSRASNNQIKYLDLIMIGHLDEIVAQTPPNQTQVQQA